MTTRTARSIETGTKLATDFGTVEVTDTAYVDHKVHLRTESATGVDRTIVCWPGDWFTIVEDDER